MFFKDSLVLQLSSFITNMDQDQIQQRALAAIQLIKAREYAFNGGTGSRTDCL